MALKFEAKYTHAPTAAAFSCSRDRCSSITQLLKLVQSHVDMGPEKPHYLDYVSVCALTEDGGQCECHRIGKPRPIKLLPACLAVLKSPGSLRGTLHQEYERKPPAAGDCVAHQKLYRATPRQSQDTHLRVRCGPETVKGRHLGRASRFPRQSRRSIATRCENNWATCKK